MHAIIAASVVFLLLLTGGAVADEPGAEQEPQAGQLSTDPAESTEPASRIAPQAIEEITVTARKREEGGQSVPISISAFTGAELEEAQTTNMFRVAELTPNFEMRESFSNARPAMYIRGIGVSDYGAEAASAVGVYRDGVYYGVQTGLTFQMFDLERTEVLRGPQGTLYGKNTTGGAVNLHSRMPGDEFGGYFKASYGNYKSFNFESAVDIPINERLKARVAFARRESDGWIENHFPGGIDDLMSTDHWAFRTILSWEPTEDLSLLLNAHGGRLQSDWTYIGRGLMDPDDVHPESFNFIDPATGDFRPGGPFNCPANAFGATGGRGRDLGCGDLRGHVGGGEKSLYDVYHNTPQTEEVNLWGASLTANYDMDTRWGPVTLTSITAYESAGEDQFEDVEGNATWGLHVSWWANTWQFTQELRAASAGDGRLDWLVGAWYFQSKIHNRNDAHAPPDGTIGRDFGFYTTSVSGDNWGTDNYAFFGQASYDLTERLSATAGLRYSWERKTSRQYNFRFTAYGDTPDVGVAQGTPCGADIEIHYDPANCGPGRSESDSWQAISGDFTLNYQLTDDIMLYASYRRGFKSGGWSTALTNSARRARDPATFGAAVLNTTVDEEILQSYEAGIKSMWFDRRLRVNFNTFFYDYDDLQVFALAVIGGQITTLLENASDATIWGGELDVMARPLPGLEVRATGAWLNTEYKDYFSARRESDFSGNELIAAPNYTGSASISYEFDLWDGVLRTQLSTSYSDELYFAAANNRNRSRAGGYWLVHGGLTYRLPDERTEISVWVRNWNDKVYLANHFDVSSLGYDLLRGGRPRHYGVTVNYSF